MGTADDMLREMVRTLPGVVYRCALDHHWTMQLISDEIEQISGYPASAFIGNAERSFASIIHPSDRARVEREIESALDGARTFVVEYRLVRADGREAWVLERGKLVEPAPGRVALDGLIFDVSDRKRAQDELRAAMAEQAAVQAVTEERVRIARELHDSVGHALSVIALQAGAAAAHLSPHDDAAGQAVSAIRAVATDTLGDMDRLLALLHEDAEPARGLHGLADVPTLVERMRAAGVVVRVDVEGSPQPLDHESDAVAYRVVQEGLTNTLKHAAGAAVTVSVGHRDDTVRIEVRNEPQPTAPEAALPPGGGRGLAGLRGRVESFGGRMSAGPTPAGGFALQAVVPRAAEPMVQPSVTIPRGGAAP